MGEAHAADTTDRLLRTQEVISRAFHSLEFYLLAGFLYFVVNYAIERLGRAVERRVSVQ